MRNEIIKNERIKSACIKNELIKKRTDPRLPYPVSGRIPDIKKGRIIRPDIRCIPSHKINAAFVRVGSIVFCFQLRTALSFFLLLLVQ